jgi:hypothetical protein
MWPPWWEWALALTGHAERRMEERGITEVDLRSMLQRATGYAPSVVEQRFMVTTSHGGRPWVVIVEPDGDEHLLVVVTAYEAVQ